MSKGSPLKVLIPTSSQGIFCQETCWGHRPSVQACLRFWGPPASVGVPWWVCPRPLTMTSPWWTGCAVWEEKRGEEKAPGNAKRLVFFRSPVVSGECTKKRRLADISWLTSAFGCFGCPSIWGGLFYLAGTHWLRSWATKVPRQHGLQAIHILAVVD